MLVRIGNILTRTSLEILIYKTHSYQNSLQSVNGIERNCGNI